MTEDDEVIDTGLVAAAVTMSTPDAEPAADPVADPVTLPAVVEAAVVPKVPMPDGWTLAKVAALVQDVAQNLYEDPYLLKKHGLSPQQFEYLQTNEFFKRALEQETLAWQGANSIQRRLALEAAIAVEDALPTVAARLSKPTEPLSDVVALLKVLSEIAGTTGNKAAGQQQPSGERFKIIINLGADTITREASVSVSPVQSQPEGEGTGSALSKLVQTS